MKGEYHVTVTGPDGVVLAARLDLAEDRHRPAAMAVDDGHLRELLVVTSICGGWIEGELIREREGA